MSFEIKGKYASAKIYTDLCEPEAVSQILTLLNQPMAEGTSPRFMPDVHAGKGCVIGTTMHVQDKLIPNLVGVDIGCGMEVTPILDKDLDFAKLDAMLHEGILVPSGFSKRTHVHPYAEKCRLSELICADAVDLQGAAYSCGSLGGGNHFIELDVNRDGQYLLVVHSGSRHLGMEVCRHYQNMAVRSLSSHKKESDELVRRLKAEGRETEIEEAVKRLRSEQVKVPAELAYLEGNLMEQYLHDMQITQEFAAWNRKAIADSIISYMGWTRDTGGFTTIHNYMDMESRILRKGAISARSGEKVIIPLSMKDGAIIAIGKGNPDWNCSAPHGAGRLMSRSAAKDLLDLQEFEEKMHGIYTTCVGRGTLDESPMAYKPAESIIQNVADTVDVIEVVRPVYNFKAC